MAFPRKYRKQSAGPMTDTQSWNHPSRRYSNSTLPYHE